MNILPHIVSEILQFKKFYILLVKSILAYNLRTRFFPDMQFSQNLIASYGASFKAQILSSLKCQILFLIQRDLSRLPNYLDNKYNFPKSDFVTY